MPEGYHSSREGLSLCLTDSYRTGTSFFFLDEKNEAKKIKASLTTFIFRQCRQIERTHCVQPAFNSNAPCLGKIEEHSQGRNKTQTLSAFFFD